MISIGIIKSRFVEIVKKECTRTMTHEQRFQRHLLQEEMLLKVPPSFRALPVYCGEVVKMENKQLLCEFLQKLALGVSSP